MRYLLLFLAFLLPQVTFANTKTYTTQSDFLEAISSHGVNVSGDTVELSSEIIQNTPPQDMRSIAVLLANDVSMDSDVEFLLEAYFSNFTFDGSGSDDVFSYASINNISQLSGYDIVIVKSASNSEADSAPQSIIEQFADNGGRVVLDPLTYSRFRQKDTYVTDTQYALSGTGNFRDMAYDGTNFWTMDDIAVDKIIKLNASTGAVESEYCAPDSVPRGIVFASGILYVSDSATDKLYALNPVLLTPYDGVCSGKYQGVNYAFSGLSPASTSPWGLEYDGSFFYSIDSASGRLYKFSISGPVLTQNNSWVLSASPLPVNLARGLAYNGTDLFLADAGSSLIYTISTSTGIQSAAIDAYDGFGGVDEDVTGIAFKGNDLWAIDDEPGIKKLYNLSSYHRVITDYFYANKANEYFRAPSTNGKGLAYDGTHFWVTDDYTNSIYKIDDSGSIVSTCLAPGSRPNGIAYYSGSLYVTDSNTDRVYTLDASTCSTVSFFSTPGTLAQGIVHDGTNLWVADSGNDTIYRLNPATGAVISSFAAPGPVTRGLAWDGTYVWSADETNDLYYALDPLTGTTQLTHTVLEITAEGITFKDGQLWSLDDSTDAIYNIDSAHLATQQFKAPSTNIGGFAYDGTFIWVADRVNNTIYKLTSTGNLVSSFASPAGSPQDIDWDSGFLWITTDANDSVYKVDTSGVVVTSFTAPGADPRGIVHFGSLLYVTDSGDNKIYRMQPSGGAVVDSFDLPGSAPGSLASDGTDIWMYDSDEKEFYKLGYFDDFDESEGLIKESLSAPFSNVYGLDFIGGNMWATESYFDIFFNMETLLTEPKVIVQDANEFTEPYKINDTFYFASRDITEGFYFQRRVVSVPETVDRKVLLASNRADSGAAMIRESRTNGGYIAVMDMGLVGRNYEISRQTVPADTLFLNSIGVHIHQNGSHENTRPTFTDLTAELNTLVLSNPLLFTKTSIGSASDGETMYVYTTGTTGKPLITFLSGTHGNEEHAYIALIRFMQSLADRYNANDTKVVNVFSEYEISFIPMINPYGIKNLVRYNQNGVDLNRNSDYQWTSFVSAYKGVAPFSEPELQALQSYFAAHSGNISFVNDAHSSMTIPPVLEWGYDAGLSEPTYISDVDVLFSGKVPFRWFEEKGGIGRWLNYDIRQPHSLRPFLTNWLTNIGIPSATTEVMGKKDIGTERMIHTSDWYYTHYDSILDSFRAKKGSSVYRFDTGTIDSVFTQAVSSNSSGPSGYGIEYRYGTSATATSSPDAWFTSYTSPLPHQYLFVEVSIKRASSQESTPILNDFTLYHDASLTVNAFAPTHVTDGSFIVSQQPDLSFNVNDTNIANTVQFQIQIDNSSDFSSPVIDYSSAFEAQGSKTFSVGQGAGSGVYTLGSSGQMLPSNASYYWRVRAINSASITSQYFTVNSGNIAFVINQLPTLSITSPINASTHDNSLINIEGIASDIDGTIASVAISLKDNMTNLYYDGSSFSSPTESFLAVSTSNAYADWIYALPSGLIDTHNYAIKARAIDNQGQETLSSEVTFTYSLATISITSPADVTMGNINGTGQSALATNMATWNVKTNNTAGYTLAWQASTAAMTNLTSDTIAAYTPATAGTPEVWSVASADSEWGAHLGSTSTTVDTGTWGAADTYGAGKWLNVDTTAYTIATRNTETLVTGDDEVVLFGGEIGLVKMQASGIYTVDVTVTVIAQ